MANQKRVLLILGVVFFAYCLLGLLTYKDFGITADEENAYKGGKILLTYYLTGKEPESTSADTIQIPTKGGHFRLYPAMLNIVNTKGYYEWFHLLNIICGFLTFAVLYLTLTERHKSVLAGLCGIAFLSLTPRFIGHIPANPKDIPFAGIYFLSLILIFYLHEKIKKPIIIILVLGILFGIVQSLRIIGLALVPTYFIYILVKYFTNKNRKNLGIGILEVCGISILSFITMYLIWPYFRLEFPHSIINIITNAKDFQYWDREILHFGSFIRKENRPQNYLFVWFLFTTPIFILGLFISSFRRLKTFVKDDLNLILLSNLFINLMMYLLFKPTIYNGLRHFLFILPILVFIACDEFILLLNSLRSAVAKKILIVLVTANTLLIAVNIIQLHPYQYLYFNPLLGGLKGAEHKFDLDYWGATYKEATEWLVSDIQLKKLEKPKVYSCNLSYGVWYYAKGAFEMVDSSNKADYIICDSDLDYKNKYDYAILHTVERKGVMLNLVRQLQ